jgi:hypothetical protein
VIAWSVLPTFCVSLTEHALRRARNGEHHDVEAALAVAYPDHGQAATAAETDIWVSQVDFSWCGNDFQGALRDL